MLRCKLHPKMRRHGLTLCCSALLLITLAPAARSQSFRPVADENLPEDTKAEGTVSVRDLNIPPKAYEDFQRGLQALHKQDSDRSAHYFAEAIKRYPQYYEAYYHLGVAQKRLGQDEKAVASFQSAINLSEGKYALAEYAYALILCKQGKVHEAERTVRYALALDQNKPAGEVALATVLLYSHRPDEAEKSAREALSGDPTSGDAYLVLAGVHGEQGDYALEVQDLDAFLTLEPQGPRTDHVRGIRQAAAGLALRAASKNPTEGTQP
jgi:tetratricopeptide (TPR) repeat protein